MFNPFEDVTLHDLTEGDLQKLIANQVAEGYTVEYKQQPPDNRKIGNTLASFANTIGGWFIIGVEDDQDNIASNVVGYDPTQFPSMNSKIREISKSRITPTPVIETKFLRLVSGREVAIVRVPPDQDTPFVSSNGKVYRRTMDSTEPVSETDRHAIDRLVDRGEKGRTRFSERLMEQWSPVVDFQEGWLNLYIRPYPLDPGDKVFIKADDLSEVMETAKETLVIFKGDHDELITGSINFDSVQIGKDCVVARITSYEDIFFDTLAVEFFPSGSSVIHIAVRKRPWSGSISQFESEEVREALARTQTRFGISGELPPREVFDFGELALNIMMAVAVAEKWMSIHSEPTEVEFGAVVGNLGGVVPFMDHRAWGEYVGRCGIPVVGSDEVRLGHNQPVRVTRDFIGKNQAVDGLGIASWVGFMLGIPTDLTVSLAVGHMYRMADRRNAQTGSPGLIGEVEQDRID